jgi:glycosyltransferase involved in cell wall biosynthesis
MAVAPFVRPGAATRLRVLLAPGDWPLWIGELLLALDRTPGIELQVRSLDAPATEPAPHSYLTRRLLRGLPALAPWEPNLAARQRLAYWKSRVHPVCDVVLSLGLSSTPLPAALQGDAVHWMLLGGDGRALCPDFPLLASMTTGQGLHLALWQQPAHVPGPIWHPLRQIRLGSELNYAKAVPQLAGAAARLISQSLADWALNPVTSAPRESAALSVQPPTPVASPWWQVLKGQAQACLARFSNRVFNEYWRIGVIDAPIHTLLDPANQPAIRWLTRPSSAGYWADPFGHPGDPNRLACEYFDERLGVGHLEVIRLNDQVNPTERQRLPVGGGHHASFPNVFELEGRHFGIAETIASRECVLHEVDAAGQWHRLHVLLQNVAAADPVLFSWEGRYWLAYTDTDRGQLDNLCFHYADALEGPWRPHVNNPVKVDISSARMAGKTFLHQGQLYRPAQDCLHTYGGAVVLHRIDTLTPTAFAETPVRRLSPDPLGPCPDGLHTLNAWGDRTLVDGKWHGVNLVATWRNLRRRLPWVKPTPVPLPENQTAKRGGKRAPTTVLVYIPHLRTGGGEISMLRVAAGLADAGCRVTVVVHSIHSQELTLPPNVKLIDLQCGSTVSAVWRLSCLLRKRRPQWVLSAFPHTNIATVVALALAGNPSRCVVSEHAPLALQIVKQANWRYRLLPPLVRWAYRRANAVVAVSEGVRRDLMGLIGPGVSPYIIHNPVLAPDFETEMEYQPRHDWLLDPALQVVISVGRLSPEKGLDTLLHAFALLHADQPETRLVMAGDGPERAALQALVTELDLSSVVSLPGRTNAPLAWMRHAAVFVLASDYEGFGNVLVEAMACGTPVVSTDCPVGPREILKNGRLGRLVPVRDAPALATAMSQALAQGAPPLAAREFALGYTQEAACARYLKLFQHLQAGGA